MGPTGVRAPNEDVIPSFFIMVIGDDQYLWDKKGCFEENIHNLSDHRL